MKQLAISHFPIKISAHAIAEPPKKSNWLSYTNDQVDPIPSNLLIDFGGTVGGYSPEELLALTIANTLICEFKTEADVHLLKYDKIEIYVALILSQDSAGKLKLSGCHIRSVVFGPNNREMSEKLLELTQNQSYLLKTIQIEKHFVNQTII